jgi:hypothetical protein
VSGALEAGDQAGFWAAGLDEFLERVDEPPGGSSLMAGKCAGGDEYQSAVGFFLLGSPGGFDLDEVADVLGDETALLELGGDEELGV